MMFLKFLIAYKLLTVISEQVCELWKFPGKLFRNALFFIFFCKPSKQSLSVVVIQRVNTRKTHWESSAENSSSTLPQYKNKKKFSKLNSKQAEKVIKTISYTINVIWETCWHKLSPFAGFALCTQVWVIKVNIVMNENWISMLILSVFFYFLW